MCFNLPSCLSCRTGLEEGLVLHQFDIGDAVGVEGVRIRRLQSFETLVEALDEVLLVEIPVDVQLGDDEDLLPLHVLHRLADLRLGVAVSIALGRVEEVDSVVVGVTNDVGFGDAAAAHADVSHLESGPAQGAVALDPGPLLGVDHAGPRRTDRQAQGRRTSGGQEITAGDAAGHRLEQFVLGHGSSSR